jgi:choline dehydrogenase-like flavoprotein
MTEELKPDYCIVGAGIAGLLVASRLVRAGHEVLVLDQGPDVTEQDRAALLAEAKREFLYYSIDYNSHLKEDVVTPTTGATVDRLFGTGGTALHFEGFMIRPVEADHQVRTLFGYGRDWPVSLKELEPWLFEAEQETGVAGNPDNDYAAPRSHPFPMQGHDYSWFDREFFGPALEKLGMKGHSCPRAVASRAYQHQDYAVRQPCGGCRFCKFCPTGARYSPDRVHGAWLKTQPDATIRNGISLRRLELSSDGSRIVAAQAKEVDGGKEVVIKAKHFVLATGGVATPRMLLLSQDSGVHSQGLGNAGGQVGVGYSGHSYSFMQLELGRHAGGRLGFETMICEYGRKHVDRTRESSWFLVGMPLSPYTSAGSIAMPWAMDGDQLSLARLREALPRMVDLLIFNELSGTGTIDLDPEQKDVFGDPVARISMPFTEWDRTADARARELADKLGEQMGALNSTVADAECWHDHPSGATAIGTSPDDGVCDSNLKVFGVDNLHLVSSSVFPHMGANPPTLTIAALALRLAAHLGDK